MLTGIDSHKNNDRTAVSQCEVRPWKHMRISSALFLLLSALSELRIYRVRLVGNQSNRATSTRINSNCESLSFILAGVKGAGAPLKLGYVYPALEFYRVISLQFLAGGDLSVHFNCDATMHAEHVRGISQKVTHHIQHRNVRRVHFHCTCRRIGEIHIQNTKCICLNASLNS